MISKFNAHTLDLSKITETKNHRNYTDECFKTLKISGSRIRIWIGFFCVKLNANEETQTVRKTTMIA